MHMKLAGEPKGREVYATETVSSTCCTTTRSVHGTGPARTGTGQCCQEENSAFCCQGTGEPRPAQQHAGAGTGDGAFPLSGLDTLCDQRRQGDHVGSRTRSGGKLDGVGGWHGVDI